MLYLILDSELKFFTIKVRQNGHVQHFYNWKYDHGKYFVDYFFKLNFCYITVHMAPGCAKRHREVAGLHQKALGGPWGTRKGTGPPWGALRDTQRPLGHKKSLDKACIHPPKMHTGSARVYIKAHRES